MLISNHTNQQKLSLCCHNHNWFKLAPFCYLVLTIFLLLAAPFVVSTKASFTVLAQQNGPKVLFISPDHGSINGGTEVRIVGVNFQEGSKVIWNGAEIPATFIDSSFLMVSSPASIPGNIAVKVINTDGSNDELPDAFTYEGIIPAPKVKLIAPTDNAVLSAGGEALTINWQIESDNLTNQRLLLSTDGGETFPFIISDSLALTDRSYLWLIPSELTTNNARIRLEAKAITTVGIGENKQDIKILAAPIISKVSPATTRTNGDALEITITGERFSKGSKVFLGNKRCKVTQLTENTITLSKLTPPEPGAYFIRIRSRNGSVSSRYIFTVAQ